MGNISELDQVPKFYARCLLGFMIQISRVFAHAHKHNLIHGAFDLSKVMVQQQPMEQEPKSMAFI